jgi:hypothetical protein
VSDTPLSAGAAGLIARYARRLLEPTDQVCAVIICDNKNGFSVAHNLADRSEIKRMLTDLLQAIDAGLIE